MANCHDMKTGEIYVCEECGIELQVIKDCKDAGIPADQCACHTDAAPCTFSCCGKDLVKKKS